MTWIVGKVMPFGYAAAVSDVRLTTEEGAIDCLQKVYPVGQSSALGFAGRPDIGFEMVEGLKSMLANEPDGGARPEDIIDDWSREAQRIYESYDAGKLETECELLLMSAHPEEHIGIPTCPRCFVHRFSAPDFSPHLAQPAGILPGVSEALSIGIGSVSAPFREVLDNADQYGSIRQEMENARHAQFLLMNAVRMVATKHPHPGVSAAVQLCLVGRGHVMIHTPRAMLIDRDTVVDFTPPPLVTDVFELGTLLVSRAAKAATARC